MNCKNLSNWNWERLKQIANEYKTPLYVTDLERVEENYERVDNTLESIKVKYAIKSNTSSSILNILSDKNCELECASLNEGIRAYKNGYSFDDIHITMVNPPISKIKRVCELSENEDISLTVGSEDSVDNLIEYDYQGELLIRAGKRFRTEDSFGKKGARMKFGVPVDNIEKTSIKAKNNLNFQGFHTHLGKQVLNKKDMEVYKKMINDLFSMIEEIGLNPKKVNLGGGLGVPNRKEQTPLDLNMFKKELHKTIPNWYDGNIIIEPGSYIVSDSTVILTKVNTVKEYEEQNSVGVDCSINELIRPAAFDSYHPIKNITSPENKEKNQTVSGPTCLSYDIICNNRKFSKSEKQDLLIIGFTGDYCFNFASYFHSYPRSKRVVIKNDKESISFKKETLEDIIKNENVPEFV